MDVFTNTTDNPMSFTSCEFSTAMYLLLSLTAVVGLLLNILPLYVVFKFQRNSTPRTQGRDVLLTALCVLDLLTLLIPLPIYLSLNEKCNHAMDRSRVTSRPSLCEMFFLMFIWLKLTAMFLVTILNYTSYLALSNRRLYKSASLGERLSSSFSCSHRRSRERINNRGRSTAVLANLVIGLALVAFTISSLPYLGLGPAGAKRTYGVCGLEQISQPIKTKEYTFLFGVLMSSVACSIVHIVHSVLSRFGQFLWRKNLKQAQELAIKVIDGRLSSLESVPKIAESYANLTWTLGIVFFASWVPLMVSMATIMSGSSLVSSELSEYAVAITFFIPLLDPMLYAFFITKYRQGYKEFFSGLIGGWKSRFVPKHRHADNSTNAEQSPTEAEYGPTMAEQSYTTVV